MLLHTLQINDLEGEERKSEDQWNAHSAALPVPPLIDQHSRSSIQPPSNRDLPAEAFSRALGR